MRRRWGRWQRWGRKVYIDTITLGRSILCRKHQQVSICSRFEVDEEEVDEEQADEEEEEEEEEVKEEEEEVKEEEEEVEEEGIKTLGGGVALKEHQ